MKKITLALFLAFSLASCSEASKMSTKDAVAVNNDVKLQVIGKYSVGDNTLYICTYLKDTLFILDKGTTGSSLSVK
jgi:hypothetical protein